MRSILFILLLLLCSCTSKQNPQSKEWTAIYSIVNDSLQDTEVKEFKDLDNTTIQKADNFLRFYQNDVLIENQIIRRSYFAEILSKKGEIVNSINMTINYPVENNGLIRYNIYVVGETKSYPFNSINEFNNLNTTFDKLSVLLINDKNRK